MYSTKGEAQICLNCQKPKCNNCLRYGGHDSEDIEQILEQIKPYLEGKVSAAQMAETLGIAATKVRGWGKKYGGMR